MMMDFGKPRSLEGHPCAASIQRILDAALQAAEPASAVQHNLALEGSRLFAGGRGLSLDDFSRIRLIGMGKAAPAMAQGALEAFGDRIHDGYLVSKHESAADTSLPDNIRITQGNHPVPGTGSLAAGEGMKKFLADSRAEDLVLVLVSGGGSALISLPEDGVSLGDLQELTQLLLASGASINEINVLRKHLDRIKGGGLARMAQPAKLVTLILSDVIGSPLDVIASGPTVPDESTYEEALAVLGKYRLSDKVPGSILEVLRAGAAGEIPETVKEGDACVENGIHVLVGSNQVSAEEALSQAQREGFNTKLLTTSLEGEASQVGEELGELLSQIATGDPDLARPACIIAGGETTVTLRGTGTGGRNTELALGAVEALAGANSVMLITLATDGEDGTGDSAGAVVTGETLAAARAARLIPANYLQDNNSCHFFHELGDLLVTGPTGTNVNDLVFLFAL